jgi:hypothetical protein
MKTVLQDLINELNQFKKFPMVDQPTIDGAISFAEIRIQAEKQQIIDAIVQASSHCKRMSSEEAEMYYNLTFANTSQLEL